MTPGTESNDTTKTLSLPSVFEEEERLRKQASQTMPHSFTTCTYDAPGGYIRQAIYLCKTCKGPDGEMGRGICAACSISCHADHEQLELFPKRSFRCDCPTTAIAVNCTLHSGIAEPPNEENTYGQNFQGRFCRCGRDYDPTTETEIMAQCVACEDWYHESCLNLRGRVIARTPESSPTKARAPTSSPAPRSSEPPSSEDEYDDENDDADMNLILSSGYDSIICGGCVAKMPVLQRWAGTKGVWMIIRPDASDTAYEPLMNSPPKGCNAGAVDFEGWEVLGEDVVLEDVTKGPPAAEGEATTSESSQKRRPASPTGTNEEPPSKRAKLENGDEAKKAACRAPPQNKLAQRVFARMGRRAQDDKDADLEVANNVDGIEGEGDIFLSEGWRDRWCRCEQCLSGFQAFPYLLEEEETYVPPEDPDSKKSLEELGLRALQNLPREKALDSIRAFNEMRDDLFAYLRPFAQEGKVVSETDVTAFFEALKAGERPAPAA
ncbi:hypothetical protein FRB96_007981 [Tulasnella sp. 330]|nr:hypothetical protein FRB96_007981 [Tulasnella sp. 330]KAG8883911.1 hypothetical protein FRB97_005585 [Tulasnella sp. 331]KAG8889230.1 hypothetical protein FRB98_005242 [Tulasnella sp. 332]